MTLELVFGNSRQCALGRVRQFVLGANTVEAPHACAKGLDQLQGEHGRRFLNRVQQMLGVGTTAGKIYRRTSKRRQERFHF